MIILSLSACAFTKRSSTEFENHSGASLVIWDADMSAAVAYNTGQICMQRALAVKTIDANTEAKISEAILNIATSLPKTNLTGNDLIAVSNSLKETAQLLTTSTERTAFLDLGMFYICQISANGGLTDQQTAELIKIIAISGAAINTEKSDASLAAAKDVAITTGVTEFVPKPIPSTAEEQPPQTK